MSLLPDGQPLNRVLPDLDDLLADPHAYLHAAPLALGPRRMYGYAAMFGLPGVGFLLSCLVWPWTGERVALGVGLLVGALIWLGWSVALSGHEIIFHVEGVEVAHRGTSVFAPWALFNVEGQPFVPQSDAPRAGLTMPIDPKLVPHVQLRRGDMVIAWGRNAVGKQWRYTARDEVILPARYEVEAADVGELLLMLGRRLGKELPATVPPPEAEVEPPDADPEPNPAGWVTVPLTRLQLPACCARCAGPRDDTVLLQVKARGDWVFGFVGGGTGERTLAVPVCEACKAVIEQRRRSAGSFGLVLGAAVGVSVGLGLMAYYGDGSEFGYWLGGFFGFVFGSMFGSVVGLSSTGGMPVRVRGYSPSRGLVSVRFTNPEVAARVIESLRQRGRPQ